jgi:hypothetical protein
VPYATSATAAVSTIFARLDMGAGLRVLGVPASASQ